jgi:uncharacterized protein
MRIAVVSDTHGHIENTRAAVRRIAQERVDAILHCGDIGHRDIIALFEGWPTHFVLGNVDSNERELAATIRQAGQTFHARFGEIELAGVQIAILHSDDQDLFEKTVRSGKYDLVCYGHTHVAKQQREGRTLVLNPGALFRATPWTIALVDLPEVVVTHVTIDE